MLLSASPGTEGTPESLGRGLQLPAAADSLRAPRTRPQELKTPNITSSAQSEPPACLHVAARSEGTAALPGGIPHEPSPRGGTEPTLAAIPKRFRDTERCERGADVSEKHPCAPAKLQMGSARLLPTAPKQPPNPMWLSRAMPARSRHGVTAAVPTALLRAPG